MNHCGWGETGRKEFPVSVKDMVENVMLFLGKPCNWRLKNHKSSDADKDNFTALLKEIRNELPAESEISFDANSFDAFLQLSIDWKAVMPLVDFVNLMTYGLPANQNGYTGHHTALYSSPNQFESANKAINSLDSMGVPMDKIIIGAAFYSFVAEQVDSINYGLNRPGKFKANVNYNKLITDYTETQGYIYYWDSLAHAPYLYNKQLQHFATFDDKKSVALKTRYAMTNLGGFFWGKTRGVFEKRGGVGQRGAPPKKKNKKKGASILFFFFPFKRKKTKFLFRSLENGVIIAY
ncbi:MAG: hypothetical protein IPL12_06825 [Bacteroidetes bacterium]|nr:hypothetical protein [Bacteroidota bacterium]